MNKKNQGKSEADNKNIAYWIRRVAKSRKKWLFNKNRKENIEQQKKNITNGWQILKYKTSPNTVFGSFLTSLMLY